MMNPDNTWPGGRRHAMYYDDHLRWNAQNYPGTRQLCVSCGGETERCEDDSIYTEDGEGPLCVDCWRLTDEYKRGQEESIGEGVAKKYQSPKGGLNDKGRAHFNRKGHNLKKPVSKSQAKKSPKAAGRRKSFCSRMNGQKRMHNIDCSKTPDKDICKSLRRWDCNESLETRLNNALYE